MSRFRGRIPRSMIAIAAAAALSMPVSPAGRHHRRIAASPHRRGAWRMLPSNRRKGTFAMAGTNTEPSQTVQ